MICYKDQTYCASKVKVHTCGREFTKQDAIDAEKWWGGKDYPVAYGEFCAPSQPNVALEQRIGRAWAVPNRYEGFPEPKLVWIKTGSWMKAGGYYKAKCPVKGCESINFLGYGYNQHYARKHSPEQWRQHAKRVSGIRGLKRCE